MQAEYLKVSNQSSCECAPRQTRTMHGLSVDVVPSTIGVLPEAKIVRRMLNGPDFLVFIDEKALLNVSRRLSSDSVV